MKLLLTKEDYNIDNGYLINYDSEELQFKQIHYIQVKDGILNFKKTLNVKDGEMSLHDCDANYHWKYYYDNYPPSNLDIIFLIDESEFLIHAMIDEF